MNEILDNLGFDTNQKYYKCMRNGKNVPLNSSLDSPKMRLQFIRLEIQVP